VVDIALRFVSAADEFFPNWRAFLVSHATLFTVETLARLNSAAIAANISTAPFRG
jgi:hypothetical protein